MYWNSPKKLINLIDTTISTDKEAKNNLNENRNFKKDIQEIEQDIDEMYLSVLHRLNSEGQDRVITYAIDLYKILEYRSRREV